MPIFKNKGILRWLTTLECSQISKITIAYATNLMTLTPLGWSEMEGFDLHFRPGMGENYCAAPSSRRRQRSSALHLDRSNPLFPSPPKKATPLGWSFLCKGYKKDIFAGFAYEFEPSQFLHKNIPLVTS